MYITCPNSYTCVENGNVLKLFNAQFYKLLSVHSLAENNIYFNVPNLFYDQTVGKDVDNRLTASKTQFLAHLVKSKQKHKKITSTRVWHAWLMRKSQVSHNSSSWPTYPLWTPNCYLDHFRGQWPIRLVCNYSNHSNGHKIGTELQAFKHAI